MKVTIDGPAGVGKTSVGKKVSEKVSFLFVKSGEFYRAVAYARMRNLGYDSVCAKPNEQGTLTLTVNDKELTNELYSDRTGEVASQLARNKDVRTFVNEKIKDAIEGRSALVEGRDIGTAVLPRAEVKIFLTASVEQRAQRRKKQIESPRSLESIKGEIRKRDQRDKERKLAPLKPAADAHILDTSDLSEREVVQQVLELIAPHLSCGDRN